MNSLQPAGVRQFDHGEDGKTNIHGDGGKKRKYFMQPVADDGKYLPLQ